MPIFRPHHYEVKFICNKCGKAAPSQRTSLHFSPERALASISTATIHNCAGADKGSFGIAYAYELTKLPEFNP